VLLGVIRLHGNSLVHNKIRIWYLVIKAVLGPVHPISEVEAADEDHAFFRDFKTASSTVELSGSLRGTNLIIYSLRGVFPESHGPNAVLSALNMNKWICPINFNISLTC
jgi:hypothetical protein